MSIYVICRCIGTREGKRVGRKIMVFVFFIRFTICFTDIVLCYWLNNKANITWKLCHLLILTVDEASRLANTFQ